MFVGKARKGKALLVNIMLGWKGLSGTNTPAYLAIRKLWSKKKNCEYVLRTLCYIKLSFGKSNFFSEDLTIDL